MNGRILPPNLFWREVASCYCDDLSLTLSSALTISAPVKLDFSTVLIVRKGLYCRPTSCFAFLVLLEWPCDRDFLWIYIIFSLIVCFSDINRKIGQRIFARCLSSTCDSADLSKTSRHFSNHFFLISCTLFNFVVLPKSHFDLYMMSFMKFELDFDE